MRILRMTLALLCCCLNTTAWAQEIPPSYTSKTKVAFGYFATVSRLCVFDDFSQPDAVTKLEETWAEVKQILEQTEQTFSVSIPTSDIARFNALAFGESVDVCPETVELLALARKMYQNTDGYYDPTVYPLVDLWGFSPRFTNRAKEHSPYDRTRIDGALPPPDERYIAAFRKLVGMNLVTVMGDAQSGYRLRKDTPPVVVYGVSYQAQLDLGGIAKGYCVDRVTALLKRKGYDYGYFSSGSSSMHLMKTASLAARNTGDPAFQLAVRKPRVTQTVGNAYAIIRAQDQSLSSSGDYDNNYLADGNLCCHLINPFTGYPLNMAFDGVQQGICTATLLSGSAAEDDAYTTALCLMGPERALDFLNEDLRDRDVVMVLYRTDRANYEVVTNLPKERLEICDAAYACASEVAEDGVIHYIGTLFGAMASNRPA
ncbi:MAG: FAD:protein FMN transferase [Clostridia bacterium]